jgi:hypothetical protein
MNAESEMAQADGLGAAPKVEATAATVENMERYALTHPAKTIDTQNGIVRVETPRCFAYSPTTGEEFSGSAGDYFTRERDEVLIDAEGDPMILVTSRVHRYDALTGELV